MKKFAMVMLCFSVCLAMCETQVWAACSGVTEAGNVKGNYNGWTHIGSVKNGSMIKIVAIGKVDFGCRACSCVDSAVAGVTASSTWTQMARGFKDAMDANIAMMDPRTIDPRDRANKLKEIYKKYYGNTHQPKYDQGGVWIKIVTKSQAPYSYVATQLYYFWEHGDLNKYGVPIVEDVDIYAKAHDGGKSPDATKGYGDNKGAYTVKIESRPFEQTAADKDLGGINTGFDVTKHGFSFGNNGWGKLCYSVEGATKLRYNPNGPFCGTDDWGLCGGMSLLAGERFRASMTSINLSKEAAKPDILNAQFRTLDEGIVAKYLAWIASPDEGHMLDPNHSVGYRMQEDWNNLIKRRLDRREPVVLGLIFDKHATLMNLREVGAVRDLFKQHQVLGIGYTMSGSTVKIRAYDPNYPSTPPNYPNRTLELSFALGKTGVSQRLFSGENLGPDRRAPRGIMFIRGVNVAETLGMINYGWDGKQLATKWATGNMGQGPEALTWLTADVDGDRKSEIVQPWNNGGQLGMIVYGWDGSKTVTEWMTGNIIQGRPGALSWLVADVDGDRKSEIVQPWNNGGRLGMIVYGWDGRQMATKWGTDNMGQGSGALTWLVADVDGDGKSEIIQLWNSAGKLGMIVYGWDGRQMATKWGTSNMGQGPGALTWLVADMAGDGKALIIQPWAN